MVNEFTGIRIAKFRDHSAHFWKCCHKPGFCNKFTSETLGSHGVVEGNVADNLL